MGFYTHRPYRSAWRQRMRENDESHRGDGTTTARVTGKCCVTGAAYGPGDRIQKDPSGGWQLVWQAPANRGRR